MRRAVRAGAAVVACSAGLLSLAAPHGAAAMADFICPGTRYVYDSNVGFPDTANTGSTCVTAYDGGTVASNGTFNAATAFGTGWAAITNIFGQLLRVTNAAGITWNLGQLPVPLSSLGNSPATQTTYSYDNLGRIQSTTAPAAQTTTYAYDSLNHMVTTVAPNGNQTNYTYDSLNRPTTMTESSGAGHTVNYSYDSLSSRPTTVTDNLGRTTTYTYDAQNNLTQRTDTAAPTTTTYTYDAQNRLQMVDSVGNRTSYAYDPAGNIMTSTMETVPPPPPPLVTQYQYDPQGHVTQVIDPAGLVTQYTYDAIGRMTSTIDGYGSPDPRATTFAYDARGNLASITDPTGTLMSFSSVPAPGSLLLLGIGLAALRVRCSRGNSLMARNRGQAEMAFSP